MRLILLIAFLILSGTPVLAQEYKQHLVKAGQIPEQAIPKEEIYYFDSFRNGVAYLRHNNRSTMKFNYNCLLDELQFLTPAGDTLAIAEPELLWKVEVDSTVFYFQKGYLRQVVRKGKTSLSLRERLIRTDSRKQAAYGYTSSTSAIDNYSNIYQDGRVFKLELKQDMVFRKAHQYFLGNAYDHFVRADKRGFFDVFANRRDAINAYIKEEKINFNIAEDILKLYEFCTSDSK